MPPPLRFKYINHRGEVSLRSVTPPFTLRHGTSQWYPKPQWLLIGWDEDKKAWREFAMARMTEIKADSTGGDNGNVGKSDT